MQVSIDFLQSFKGVDWAIVDDDDDDSYDAEDESSEYSDSENPNRSKKQKSGGENQNKLSSKGKKKKKFYKQKPRSQQSSDKVSTKTNPNSLYRKYYNQSKDFFLWVINQEEPPYIFKLHIQGESAHDCDIQMMRNSIARQIKQHFTYFMEVRVFEQKFQFKVFLEFSIREQAREFFQKFYKMPHIEIVDQKGTILFTRKMRCYIVKDEGTFERLALEKYQEDDGQPYQSSGGGSRYNSDFSGRNFQNQSSNQKKKGGSYNNSSGDDSQNGSIGGALNQLNNSRRSDNLPQTSLTSFEHNEEIKQQQTQIVQNEPPKKVEVARPPKRPNNPQNQNAKKNYQNQQQYYHQNNYQQQYGYTDRSAQYQATYPRQVSQQEEDKFYHQSDGQYQAQYQQVVQQMEDNLKVSGSSKKKKDKYNLKTHRGPPQDQRNQFNPNFKS